MKVSESGWMGALCVLSVVVMATGCGDDSLEATSDTGSSVDVFVGGSDASGGCTVQSDCAGTVVAICHAAICQAGSCVAVPVAIGASCAAGDDPCFPVAMCNAAGTCAPQALNCDDNNACTTDACTAGAGCSNTPIDDCGVECKTAGDCLPIALPACQTQECQMGECIIVGKFDGTNCDDDVANLPCMASGACEDGKCIGVPKNCDDGLECTTDSCIAADGTCVNASDDPLCVPPSCEADGDCKDLDLGMCKKPGCVDGTCIGVPADDGNACADEGWATNPCIEGGTCKAGNCTANQKNCDDAVECTADTCDPATGACGHVPSGEDCVQECEESVECGAGAYCSGGLVPGIGAKTCAPLKADLVACFDDGQCASGTCGGCIDVAGIEAGWCYTAGSKDIEQPCKANDECLSGDCTALCPVNLTGVCECQGAADCPENFVCDKGFLGNVCVEKPDALAVGEACDDNDECKSGQCEGDFCVCDVDSDCEEGQYCNAIPAIANTCETAKAECDTCILDKECGVDAICLALGLPIGTPKCVQEASKELGEPCCKNAQCKQGSCDDSVCTE